MNSQANLNRIVALVFLLVTACSTGENRSVDPVKDQALKEKLKDDLIQQNKQLILEEMDLIDAFVERKHLNFDTTSTGLRFKIIAFTNGKPARLMSDVSLSYSLSLLNGDLCYSSDSTGLLSFTLGQSDQPAGLQEALLKMKEGEEALIIVPSYLAYGITGDGICIPGSTSLFYTIKLEKVN